MKRRRVTKAVLDRNRTNAKKSTGPRTAAGKSAAARSAIVHGFFARELVLNDEDTRLFKALRRKLHSQLLPQTVLQGLAFSLILSCLARCKLALRQEVAHIRRLVGDFNAPQDQRGSEDQVSGTEWYLSGKQALRDGLKLIAAVRAEYEHLGRIDPRWHVLLDKAFGPQFRQLITEWPSSDKEAVLLAHTLKEHATTYDMPSLGEHPSPEGEGEKPPEVILDPEQNRRAVLKLLQLEEDTLSGLWKSLEHRASDSAKTQNEAVDFDPRFFPKARRDLRAAVDWYLDLKEDKL